MCDREDVKCKKHKNCQENYALKIPYQLVVNGTKIGHFGVKLSAMNEQSVINYSSRARELGSVNERGTYTKTS